MKMNDFLTQHPVFTLNEFCRFQTNNGSENTNTRKALLAYYRRQGRIIHVRRGLYAVVPPGSSADSYPVDPFLLASRMAEDAVLAYHTALEFYGKAYSVQSRFYYLSRHKSIPLRFRGHEFMRVSVSPSLSSKGKEMFGVKHYNRAGVELKVTDLERTLVDVMDRPDLSGSWEEIWRSLESVEFFDLERVIEYARILENATTAAKVGFFLDCHKETLMVGDDHIEPLKKLHPRQPHYMMRGTRKDCRLVKEWNLMAPEEILNRSWEEVI
jgi:predicted transcriptional regulator of viral defense system